MLGVGAGIYLGIYILHIAFIYTLWSRRESSNWQFHQMVNRAIIVFKFYLSI